MKFKAETQRLFHQMWAKLKQEEEELAAHYEIARNLGCSKWSQNFIGILEPTKILKESMTNLRHNYELLRSEISFKKFLLIRTFTSQLGDSILNYEMKLCFDHWSKHPANKEIPQEEVIVE